MHAVAKASARLAQVVRDSINHFRVLTPSDRQRVSQALLAASVDHAASLTHLLSIPSPSAAFSGVGLFRLQLDALARGIYFARSETSSDEDLANFLENDRMPQVATERGKKRSIHLKELIDGVREFIAVKAPDLAAAGLVSRFTYGLGQFNGYVHGGNEVVKAYQEHERHGLIFMPDFKSLANVCLHAATLSLFAELTQIFVVAGKANATFPNAQERDRIYGEFVKAGKVVRAQRGS